MILLKEIVYKVAIEAVKGSTDIAVNKMEFDSRNIGANDIFVLFEELFLMVTIL